MGSVPMFYVRFSQILVPVIKQGVKVVEGLHGGMRYISIDIIIPSRGGDMLTISKAEAINYE